MSHYQVVIRKPNTVKTVSFSVQAKSERQAEKLAEVYFQERFGYWPAPELTEKVELSNIGRIVHVVGKDPTGDNMSYAHGDIWQITENTDNGYIIACVSGCDETTEIFSDGDGEVFIWDFV